MIVSSLNNDPFGTSFDGGPIAYSSPFRTGPQACTLDSVTVLLTWGNYSDTNVFPANLRVLSDAGNQPGTVLEDLGWLPITNRDQGTLLPYTFSAQGGLPLSPFTTYWVSVGDDTNSYIAVGRDLYSSFQYAGAPGATMTATNYLQFDPAGPWFNQDQYPVVFEVDGTVLVPTLQVMPIGHQIVLSWPSFATNYVLG